jgi:hypothetical protein
MKDTPLQLEKLFQGFESDSTGNLMPKLLELSKIIQNMDDEELCVFYRAMVLFTPSLPQGSFFFPSEQKKTAQRIKGMIFEQMKVVYNSSALGGSSRGNLYTKFKAVTGKNVAGW